MNKVPPIIPISDLRKDAASVLQQVRSTKGPMIITQRGRATVIMLSLEEYEKNEYERELLLLLAKGEKEVEAGEGYDLDSVLSDADAILG